MDNIKDHLPPGWNYNSSGTHVSGVCNGRAGQSRFCVSFSDGVDDPDPVIKCVRMLNSLAKKRLGELGHRLYAKLYISNSHSRHTYPVHGNIYISIDDLARIRLSVGDDEVHNRLYEFTIEQPMHVEVRIGPSRYISLSTHYTLDNAYKVMVDEMVKIRNSEPIEHNIFHDYKYTSIDTIPLLGYTTLRGKRTEATIQSTGVLRSAGVIGKCKVNRNHIQIDEKGDWWLLHVSPYYSQAIQIATNGDAWYRVRGVKHLYVKRAETLKLSQLDRQMILDAIEQVKPKYGVNEEANTANCTQN